MWFMQSLAVPKFLDVLVGKQVWAKLRVFLWIQSFADVAAEPKSVLSKDALWAAVQGATKASAFAAANRGLSRSPNRTHQR